MALRRHVEGLDTARFVAALWVALSHGAAFPVKSVWLSPGPIGHLFIGLYDCLFNGIAAVVVFFIISGFCIHYPWVHAESVNCSSHLIRRYVRIGGPLLIVWALTMMIGGSEAVQVVLWSVYCELIYYLFYPILFMLFRWVGVFTILGISTAVALILIATHPDYHFPWQFGISLTWLVSMPAWLLGCLLAQLTSNPQQPPLILGRVLPWRLAALAYTATVTAVVFHSPVKIGYPLPLFFFSFFAYFWLKRELWRYSRHPPPRVLEWLGTWSYSIYLVHNLVLHSVSAANLSPAIGWCIAVPGIAAASYLFALLVEFPSHQAARHLGRILPSSSNT